MRNTQKTLNQTETPKKHKERSAAERGGMFLAMATDAEVLAEELAEDVAFWEEERMSNPELHRRICPLCGGVEGDDCGCVTD